MGYQPPLAVRVLAHRRALGAMGAQVEWAVPARLLAHPDPVLDFCEHGAADRAVCADGFSGLKRRGHSRLRLGFPDGAAGEGGRRRQTAHREARPAQEGAAIDGLVGDLGQD